MFLLRAIEVRTATARPGGGGPADAGGAILTANGYVEARHQASVAARTTGRLASLLVEEGDAVEADQVLARLIDEDQRAAVAQADANLALARARLEQANAAATDTDRRSRRRVELLERGLVSAEESEEAATAAQTAAADRVAAEASVRAAQAALQTARLELDKTEIRAPFAGVVLRKDAEVGEIVGPIMTSNTARAGAVVTIADVATLEVGVDVNESYIARLSIGMPADIVLDAHPDVHFPGDVRTIFPSADRDRATIPVRVQFVASDGRVRPDLGAKVTFLERRTTEAIVTVPRTIRIPDAAVFERDGEKIAWVVREGKLAAAPITIGATEGEETEVVSGLAEGDQVVLGPAKGLKEGKRVRVAAS
jgi:RND family efflux transporter MFP subunit